MARSTHSSSHYLCQDGRSWATAPGRSAWLCSPALPGSPSCLEGVRSGAQSRPMELPPVAACPEEWWRRRHRNLSAAPSKTARLDSKRSQGACGPRAVCLTGRGVELLLERRKHVRREGDPSLPDIHQFPNLLLDTPSMSCERVTIQRIRLRDNTRTETKGEGGAS